MSELELLIMVNAVGHALVAWGVWRTPRRLSGKKWKKRK